MHLDIKPQRHLADLLPRSNQRAIVIVRGPRQAGKTALLKKIYNHLNYFCLDTLEGKSLLEKIPAVSWGRQIGNAIVDEVQKSSSALGKIRFAFDQRQIEFCAAIGSIDFLPLERNLEQLATRAKVFELWPLMLVELANMRLARRNPPLVSKLLECEGPLDSVLSLIPALNEPIYEQAAIDAFNYLAKWGGMSALINMDGKERSSWLGGYFGSYLRFDLEDHARQADPKILRDFAGAIANKITKNCSYSDLAWEAGMPVAAVRTHLKHLQTAFQTFEINPYNSTPLSSKERDKKIYWSDTGILRGLSKSDFEPALLFENLVVSEIIKWIRTCGDRTDVFFFSARSGGDVKLVLETPTGFIGVQIQNQLKAVTGDAEALSILARAVKSKWIGGLIVTRGRQLRTIDGKLSIWEIPATRLLGPHS